MRSQTCALYYSREDTHSKSLHNEIAHIQSEFIGKTNKKVRGHKAKERTKADPSARNKSARAPPPSLHLRSRPQTPSISTSSPVHLLQRRLLPSLSFTLSPPSVYSRTKKPQRNGHNVCLSAPLALKQKEKLEQRGEPTTSINLHCARIFVCECAHNRREPLLSTHASRIRRRCDGTRVQE